MKGTWRKLLLGGCLLLGCMGGAPMRPEDIQQMLRETNQVKVVQVETDETPDGIPVRCAMSR